MAAEEILVSQVQNSNPPAAIPTVFNAGANEPGPISPIVAVRPREMHSLFYVLPVFVPLPCSVGKKEVILFDFYPDISVGLAVDTPLPAKRAAWVQ
jgi:hypothetical protein